jgi:NitT/TauT family transport system substrate-binding protein
MGRCIIQRIGRLLAGTLVSAAAACPAVLPAPAAAQTPLRFSFDARLEAPLAIFLVPQDKGYYKQAGLDLTFDDGTTSLDTIGRVASGSHDAGFADLNMLIRYRDQNPAAPVRAVFMVYNLPPFAIIARKSRGITEPKQIEGKKLGAPTNAATFPEWPVFAKLNAIDVTKVTLENIATAVRAPMLAAGQLDAALGYSFRVYVDLKDRGVPVDDIVLLPMTNYGLKLYGSTIVVNTKFAAEKPEAVRGLLSAVVKGLKDTVRHPGIAVEAMLKRDDMARRDLELERLQMALRDNILTPEVRANGLGAVDPARLDESIEQLALSQVFKAKPKADDIFNPAFLPPRGDRGID